MVEELECHDGATLWMGGGAGEMVLCESDSRTTGCGPRRRRREEMRLRPNKRFVLAVDGKDHENY